MMRVGDPIDDDDSDTTTNIIMSKKVDPKTKLDPSKIRFYIKMKRLKSWFNPEASKVMEGLLPGGESMLEGEDVAFFLTDNSVE
jgi:hypothetical protein